MKRANSIPMTQYAYVALSSELLQLTAFAAPVITNSAVTRLGRWVTDNCSHWQSYLFASQETWGLSPYGPKVLSVR